MNLHEKTISEMMTPLPVTVDPSSSLQTVSHLMRRYDIRHLPVLDGEKLVGLAVERDVETVIRLKFFDVQTEPVRTVMAKIPLSVSSDALVCEVIKEMMRTKGECALVLKNTKVVGIFTYIDIIKLLIEP